LSSRLHGSSGQRRSADRASTVNCPSSQRISPPIERMKAKTIELDSAHLSLITHPRQITKLILRAARHS
jgi:hypothetical protein